MSGSPDGTSGTGPSRWSVGPWRAIALVGLVIVMVNATSDVIERDDIHWIEPFFWEASSLAILLAVAPLVGRAVRRWPPDGGSLARNVGIHFALTVPFALAHILTIFVVREVGYRLAGAYYGFFDDGIAITLLYEWRKDVLVYAGFAAVYFLWARPAASSVVPAPEPARLEIRDGASVTFLAPGDLLYVQAAGNYVELHTTGRMHLVRGTLATWEEKLAEADFVRIHRSRLVNRRRIVSLTPTASGDVQVTLENGLTLPGSRRYRAGLSGA